MSLKIYAPLLTFATKLGRYLRKMDKRGIGTLSFVRASSEPVMCKRWQKPEPLPVRLQFAFISTQPILWMSQFLGIISKDYLRNSRSVAKPPPDLRDSLNLWC